jgi:glycosyltransferase involved in cell wall biosynthesis
LERNPLEDKDFIFIQHLTPENFYIDPRAKYHICYTPFETDGAPLSWLLPLRGMDEIWVPSEHNKKAYVRAGIRPDKIIVIPHGVDEKRFNPEVKKLEYNKGKFNFGSVFDWTERKNPVALIRAYFNAFQKGEDVTLTIRTFWRFPIEKTKEYIKNEVEKIKRGFGDTREFPKILFWFDPMEEELMPSFYRSFDCFVLPTRGEGFGLPFLEAMACGVPAIGPSWGGNTEFMKPENSILVNGKVIQIEHADFLQRQPQYAGQRWFDIDEAELTKAMRFAYDNQDRCQNSAMIASEYVRNNFTWSKTALRIQKRLEEIVGLSGKRTVDDSSYMTGV